MLKKNGHRAVVVADVPVIKRDNDRASSGGRITPTLDGKAEKTCINNRPHLPPKDFEVENIRPVPGRSRFEALSNVVVHENEGRHD
jgi:hypothetical protein